MTNGASKYCCVICGYIYDPKKGDEETLIDEDTSFDDLPMQWVCPACGSEKDTFKRMH